MVVQADLCGDGRILLAVKVSPEGLRAGELAAGLEAPEWADLWWLARGQQTSNAKS